MGVPVLVGWLAGDTSAGLMAAIGGFTSLYGSGRPYVLRARLLAVVALSLACAVALGMWVAAVPWLAILTVAAIAMLATWLCNALRTGPPGAYMFMLACAAGTAMPVDHIEPGHTFVLVLGGGLFAWAVHMTGAWFRPRGPEQDAVVAAGRAVVRYLEAIGTPRERAGRHAAALLLHDAWSDLTRFQPRNLSAGSRLSRLRGVNRDLHLLFADAMGVASRDRTPHPAARDQALALIEQAAHLPPRTPATGPDALPLGRPGIRAALVDAMRPGSLSRRVVLRVGVAALAAGALGAALHLERAYWAVAAAVLMLHQGFDWPRMLQRSVERVLGTGVGLLLAGAVLAWQPQGLWLVLAIVVLQFCIEMLVVRNYALAVVFITGAALTIATGGLPVADVGGFLAARGIDTAAGCALALLVFWLLPPRPAAQLPDELARTLHAVAAVVRLLATGEVTSAAARTLRRDLQARSFALEHAYEAATTASLKQRRAAERTWPVIAATQRLVYRTLSTAWRLERPGSEDAGETDPVMFDPVDAAATDETLHGLAETVLDGRARPPAAELPAALAEELHHLHDALAHYRAGAQD